MLEAQLVKAKLEKEMKVCRCFLGLPCGIMVSFTRFGTICTVQKTHKIPLEECYI